MKSIQETLKCGICEVAFVGRRPPETIDPICPMCLTEMELPIIGFIDDISDFVNKELELGGGEFDDE